MLSLNFLSRPKPQPKQRTRALHFDSLESRALLTSIDPAVLLVVEPADLTVAVETASGGSNLTGNGGSDYSYTPQEPSQEAGAPQITFFNWDMDGGEYIFYGLVVDDKPVTEVTVFLSGLVSASTQVSANGYFTISITWGTQFGNVNAQAQDADGLWSNIETLYAS